MGFDRNEQLSVLRIVLAVLFIGNIQFQEDEKEGSCFILLFYFLNYYFS